MPPPLPITRDAAFDPDEDDEDPGDGDVSDDETDGDGDGDTSGLVDAGGDDAADAQVTPEEPGPSACTQTTCGASCVDLASDAQHCGVCDHRCPGGAACSAGVCASPSGDCTYQLREGHDYLFCSDENTWAKARERCKSFGLDLVIVDDAAENEFVKGSTSRWIGLVNDDDGPFRWIAPGSGEDGAAPSFTLWANDEPNNDEQCLIPIPGFPLACTREDCGEILASGAWNDAYCDKSDTKRGYVCESY